MSGSIGEVRALMRLFDGSPWRDLYVHTGDWTIFFAKPDGAANPMRSGSADMGATIDAPHLGIFTSAMPAGSAVSAGTVIGRLEILGDHSDVTSDRAGTLDAILIEDGALAEYGAPLVRIIPA